MSISGEQMLDVVDDLRSERGKTTVSCTPQEATDLRAFLYRNGIEVEVIKRAKGTYRFIRQEGSRAPA